MYIIISIVCRLHVEETNNMHEFVYNGAVSEAAEAGRVESQVHGVHSTFLPVADVGVATVGKTLCIEINK